MRIFLDTANIEEIKQAAKLGVISGITTNPSLISQAKATNYEAAIKEIEAQDAGQHQGAAEQGEDNVFHR